MSVVATVFIFLQGVDYEVRAGLSSSYGDPRKGWVADDIHSESVSRTLGYACENDMYGTDGTQLMESQMMTMPLRYSQAIFTSPRT